MDACTHFCHDDVSGVLLAKLVKDSTVATSKNEHLLPLKTLTVHRTHRLRVHEVTLPQHCVIKTMSRASARLRVTSSSNGVYCVVRTEISVKKQHVSECGRVKDLHELEGGGLLEHDSVEIEFKKPLIASHCVRPHSLSALDRSM